MATRRGFLKALSGALAAAPLAPGLMRQSLVSMPDDAVAAMETAVTAGATAAPASKAEMFVVGHGKIMQRHQGRWSIAHDWGNAHRPTMAETQAVLDGRHG